MLPADKSAGNCRKSVGNSRDIFCPVPFMSHEQGIGNVVKVPWSLEEKGDFFDRKLPFRKRGFWGPKTLISPSPGKGSFQVKKSPFSLRSLAKTGDFVRKLSEKYRKLGRSRMSGRRTSGSSRPSLGVQVLAVFSFIS